MILDVRLGKKRVYLRLYPLFFLMLLVVFVVCLLPDVTFVEETYVFNNVTEVVRPEYRVSVERNAQVCILDELNVSRCYDGV